MQNILISAHIQYIEKLVQVPATYENYLVGVSQLTGSVKLHLQRRPIFFQAVVKTTLPVSTF